MQRGLARRCISSLAHAKDAAAERELQRISEGQRGREHRTERKGQKFDELLAKLAQGKSDGPVSSALKAQHTFNYKVIDEIRKLQRGRATAVYTDEAMRSTPSEAEDSDKSSVFDAVFLGPRKDAPPSKSE
eukprot:Sspe_Gene.83167::Locus_54551_Transcript_1_1_Confidence_1.000_Length_446::g.83167::m.83167